MAEEIHRLSIRGSARVVLCDGVLQCNGGKFKTEVQKYYTKTLVVVNDDKNVDQDDFAMNEDDVNTLCLNLYSIVLHDNAKCDLYDTTLIKASEIVFIQCEDESEIRVKDGTVSLAEVRVRLEQNAKLFGFGKLVVETLYGTLKNTGRLVGVTVLKSAEIVAENRSVCVINKSRHCLIRTKNDTLACIQLKPIENETEQEKAAKNADKRERARQKRLERKRTAQEVTQAAVEAGIFGFLGREHQHSSSSNISYSFEPREKKPRVENPVVISDDDKDERTHSGPAKGMCAVCWTNPIRTFYMPCGHASLCNECSVKSLEVKAQCVICRSHVNGIGNIRVVTE